jgi:hypothetical protein
MCDDKPTDQQNDFGSKIPTQRANVLTYEGSLRPEENLGSHGALVSAQGFLLAADGLVETFGKNQWLGICAPLLHCGALVDEPSVASESISMVKPTVKSGLVGDITFTPTIRMKLNTPG